MTSNGWEILGVVTRVGTSSTVAARILETVREANMPEGSLLPPERELATMLGVSRTTVREAIHELTLKGIVQRRQGSGTVLLSQSLRSERLLGEMSGEERDRREVTDFRVVFEPQIAGLAAERRTDTDLIMLNKLCSADVLQLSPDESLEMDHEFHASVAAATHNTLIVALSRASSEWVCQFRRQSHVSDEGRRISLGGHREILDAIVRSDIEQASNAMREHIETVSKL